MPRIIESDQKNIVGKKIRQLRIEKHMTQQELSARKMRNTHFRT